MGGCDFMCQAEGRTADEAFGNAVEEATYEKGHDPYNGTISTISDGFNMIPDTWKDIKAKYVKTLEMLAGKLKELQAMKPRYYDVDQLERWMEKLPVSTYLYLREAKTKTGAMNEIRKRMKHLRKKRDACTAKMTPMKIAEALLYDIRDDRVIEKRGPCGCIDLDPKLTGKRKPKRFLFFGTAAC